MTKKEKARDKYLFRKYGMYLFEYRSMLHGQNGVCALCGTPPKKGKNLHVEHNHRTGKTRALCCFYCNKRRIGQLNLEWAEKVYLYMVKYDG
jgi:Recombination endonuclease VII